MGERTWCLVVSCVLATLYSPLFAVRLHCGPGDVAPNTRVNTTLRLASFRASLASILVGARPLSAFIVTSADAHNSEYPAAYDQRRSYISGFEGSAGTAVVTETKAALWTDGRYYLEAEETLDCNWMLMKSGLSGTPTITSWLNSELSAGDLIGVDKTLFTHASFLDMRKHLLELSKGTELVAVSNVDNPVDRTWTVDRPQQPNNPINALPIKFAGVSWQEKIQNLRSYITAKNAGAFVVTGLDEIAWLFNLRGTDVAYTPFFLGFAIVELNKIRLYILSKDRRLQEPASDPETTSKLATHLGTTDSGSCDEGASVCVEVRDYNQTEFEHDLTTLAATKTVWITNEANYAIYVAVQNNSIIDTSPIAEDKSIKNTVERGGMQRAYNRDSAALIKFLAFLDKEIKEGRHWTEVSAGYELDKRRRGLVFNRGLSFETISGYGSNGAIIHYRPLNATDKKISTDNFYLLDSGGQYLDGTTDVTRTMHYGTPTRYHKECYTRVLMSSINLANAKWPQGLYGRQIDALARYQLWDVGFVFNHGTGHGIGAYLSVHEGPGRIYISSTSSAEKPLKKYEFYSDEPGYYEDGNFGIRLETIVTVVSFTPKYDTADQNFLQFAPVTLVPFEPKLTDYSLLNDDQVKWLNYYNNLTRVTMLPLLQDDQLAIKWLNDRTQEIRISEPNTAANTNRGRIHTSTNLVVKPWPADTWVEVGNGQ